MVRTTPFHGVDTGSNPVRDISAIGYTLSNFFFRFSAKNACKTACLGYRFWNFRAIMLLKTKILLIPFNIFNISFREYILELKFKFMYSILMFILTTGICYEYKNQILFLLSEYLMLNINSKRFFYSNLTHIF